MKDIFSETKESLVPTWAVLKNAGEKVQGTYVGRIDNLLSKFGNRQNIYQLLQHDASGDKLVNVAIGVNKKFINDEMQKVNFGQIIGFVCKGMVKVKFQGVMVDSKDYGLYQDPKIVDEAWLKENDGNMPKVINAEAATLSSDEDDAEKEFENFGKEAEPFPSSSSVTDEDKLAIINKLASDKLAISDPSLVKDKVMEVTGIAFVPVNYDKIVAALKQIA